MKNTPLDPQEELHELSPRLAQWRLVQHEEAHLPVSDAHLQALASQVFSPASNAPEAPVKKRKLPRLRWGLAAGLAVLLGVGLGTLQQREVPIEVGTLPVGTAPPPSVEEWDALLEADPLALVLLEEDAFLEALTYPAEEAVFTPAEAALLAWAEPASDAKNSSSEDWFSDF